MTRSVPVARIAGSDLIVFSDGDVIEPHSWYDDDIDEVAPNDDECTQVLVVKNKKLMLVEHRELELITLH